MRFLVTRQDALYDFTAAVTREKRCINTSELWPSIVEAETHAEAVKKVYECSFVPQQKLPMNRPFLVVALIDAEFITFKPRENYFCISSPAF